MPGVRLAETTPLVEAASGTPTARRFEIRVIESDIWGSCGFYPKQVLQEAADNKVFAAGTKCFLDHPSISEAHDRPERSVRDLAGRLTSDAEMRPDGLYATVEVFPHMAPIVEGLAGAVGMSIRANGIAEAGTADGREGMIVRSIDEASSVDFVTAAGAGGKVTRLLESARPGDLTEMAPGFTAGDMRMAIAAALEDAYPNGVPDADDTAETPDEDESYLFIEDFTDSWVVFTSDDDLYQQTYTVASGTVTLTGSPAEVTRHTTYTVDPPDAAPSAAVESAPPTAPKSEEDAMPATEMTEADRLRESAQRLSETGEARLAESERRNSLLEARLNEFDAREAARPIVTAALAESRMPQASRQRVVDHVMGQVPIAEGKLNREALTERVKTARMAEELYVADLAESLGVGRVAGLGGGTSGIADDAEIDRQLNEAFTGLGLNESARLIAVRGRA